VPNILTDTKASQRELYIGLRNPTFKNIPYVCYEEGVRYIMLYRRNLCFSEICNSCGLVISTAWLIMISINDNGDDDVMMIE
jgi:hypothetical protein